jgi:cation transporter-like permease
MRRKALFPLHDRKLACRLLTKPQHGSEEMTTLRLKQELYSFAQTFASCVVLALVLGGIGGTIYKVISPEGVAQAFGRSLSAGVAAIGSMVLISALAWFSRAWGDPERGLVSYFVVYGFAAAGILYLLQLWTKGTL